MDLLKFGPVLNIWENIRTLYEHYEDEGLLAKDLPEEVPGIIKAIPTLSDEETLVEVSKIFQVEVKFLQEFIRVKFCTVLDFRRLLACRELSLVHIPDCPQSVRYRVVGRRYGFSYETVRKFYQRYPHYFRSEAVTNFFV